MHGGFPVMSEAETTKPPTPSWTGGLQKRCSGVAGGVWRKTLARSASKDRDQINWPPFYRGIAGLAATGCSFVTRAGRRQRCRVK
jgi:hypothetical protein